MIRLINEWVFTAYDLDSGDSIVDVVNLKSDLSKEEAFNAINELVLNKHPITTITGNTWEVEDIELTGRTYSYNTETKEYTLLTERSDYYKDLVYPIMNME